MRLSDLELENILTSPLNMILPTDTVAVERAVKDVTSVALKCINLLERDGMIFMMRESCRDKKVED